MADLRRSKFAWLLVGLVCVIAPFVHFYVQVYWSIVAMSLLPLHTGGLDSMFLLFTVDAVGAGLSALILAAPLAWFTQVRPLICASLLALVTLATAMYTWQGSYDDRAAVLTFVELLVFFLLCWALASLVVRIRPGHRVANLPAS